MYSALAGTSRATLPPRGYFGGLAGLGQGGANPPTCPAGSGSSDMVMPNGSHLCVTPDQVSEPWKYPAVWNQIAFNGRGEGWGHDNARAIWGYKLAPQEYIPSGCGGAGAPKCPKNGTFYLSPAGTNCPYGNAARTFFFEGGCYNVHHWRLEYTNMKAKTGARLVHACGGHCPSGVAQIALEVVGALAVVAGAYFAAPAIFGAIGSAGSAIASGAEAAGSAIWSGASAFGSGVESFFGASTATGAAKAALSLGTTAAKTAETGYQVSQLIGGGSGQAQAGQPLQSGGQATDAPLPQATYQQLLTLAQQDPAALQQWAAQNASAFTPTQAAQVQQLLTYAQQYQAAQSGAALTAAAGTAAPAAAAQPAAFVSSAAGGGSYSAPTDTGATPAPALSTVPAAPAASSANLATYAPFALVALVGLAALRSRGRRR